MMLARIQIMNSALITRSIFTLPKGQTAQCLLKPGVRTALGRCDVRFAQTSSSASQVTSSHIEAFGTSGTVAAEAQSPTLQLNFSSHSFAFKHKTTRELLRGLLVLHACSIDTLVNHSYRLLTLGERIIGEKLLSIAVSPFYNQFVAGDSEEELAAISRSLHEVHVKLMVAPMLETDVDEGHDLEAMYQKNLDKTLFLIEMSSRNSLCDRSLPICQTKHTAHLSADVLARISTAYESLSEDKQAEAVKVLAELMETAGKKLFQDAEKPSESSSFSGTPSLDLLGLKKDDCQQLLDSLPRFYMLGEKCVKDKVILAVDAEYTYTNPAINLLTLAMMKIFNANRRPLIWNTYQGYLKAGRQNLEHDLRLVRAIGNFGFGAKIVRGAYLERERSFAMEQNIPDPVNDTYEDTGDSYNSMVHTMLHEVQQNSERRAVIVASHNEESVKLAAQRIEELGLDPLAGNVVFGQVYGMAENITLPLAHCGYLVYKSIPYGSMLEVMPYLSRRANENRAVLNGARKERQLLSQEIRSRISFSP